LPLTGQGSGGSETDEKDFSSIDKNGYLLGISDPFIWMCRIHAKPSQRERGVLSLLL
jgi:hypothetical protein